MDFNFESFVDQVFQEAQNSVKARGEHHSKSLTPSGAVTHAGVIAISSAYMKRCKDTTISRAMMVEECVRRCTKQSDQDDETLKLQAFCKTQLESLPRHVQNIKKSSLKKSSATLKAILKAPKLRNMNALTKLYDQIILYIVQSSRSGEPTELAVLRETKNALETVFPQSELPKLLDLNMNDRKEQLENLVDLSRGFRLFDRHIQKTAHGIPDLWTVVNKDLKTIRAKLMKVQEKCESRLASLPGTKETLSQAIFYHQLLKEAKATTQSFEIQESQVASLFRSLDTIFGNIRDQCKNKEILATDVYPNFIALSKAWEHLEEQNVVLDAINNMLDGMLYFLNSAVDSGETLVNEAEHSMVQESDIDALKAKVASLNSSCRLVSVGEGKDFDDNDLKYSSFCPVSLVNESHLVKGDSNLGVLACADGNYSFASAAHCLAFVQSADQINQGVHKIVDDHAALIDLLNTKYTRVADKKKNSPFENFDHFDNTIATQTDTHIAYNGKAFIDLTYTWNEWDMRRRALQLCNLRQKVTKSAQTENASHFRREVATQSWAPKNQETQTRRDNSTNIPRKVQVIGNLRGKKNARVVVHQLTLDL